MTTKINSFKSHKQQLINVLKPRMKEIVEEQVNKIFKDMIEELYNMTFEYWRGGSHSSESKSKRRKIYTRPSVYFSKPRVRISGTTSIKINVNIRSIAQDDSGKPHELWYWLDFGTKTITWDFPYPSALFPVRSGNRTTPGTLKVRPTPVYGDELRIYPGQTRAGIEPRKWSYQIGIELQKKLSNNQLGKDGWRVIRTSASRP